MAFLHVPNAWHVQQFFTSDEDTWSNVFGADVGALETLTQGTSDTLTDAIASAFFDHLRSVIDASVTLDRIVVTDLRTEGAPQFQKAYGTPGTGAGDRLPDELAIVITTHTSFRSPKGRGRLYIAGFSEGSNDAGGVVTDATVAQVLEYGNALRTGMAAVSDDLGVISRVDPGFGFTGTIRPVTSCTVSNNIWKSQRRRRRAA